MVTAKTKLNIPNSCDDDMEPVTPVASEQRGASLTSQQACSTVLICA